MISLQFKNVDSLYKELEKKVTGINELLKPATKNEVSKALFTITGKKFLKDIGIAARLDPQKFFHVFEWGQLGSPAGKLFLIKRTRVIGGNLSINFVFTKSNKNVPVPAKIRSKVKKRSVFANKAEIMESGKPVSFTTKQTIVFLSQKDGNVHFVGPRVLINIKNPGGRKTTNAFEKYANTWYLKKSNIVLSSSGLVNAIGKSVSSTLNKKGAGPSEARMAISNTAQKYSQGVTEF
jgi:hypothetical protein